VYDEDDIGDWLAHPITQSRRVEAERNYKDLAAALLEKCATSTDVEVRDMYARYIESQKTAKLLGMKGTEKPHGIVK